MLEQMMHKAQMMKLQGMKSERSLKPWKKVNEYPGNSTGSRRGKSRYFRLH